MARSRLPTWAPGLAALRRYRLADLPHDVTGGIAVAAVTVPVGIANAQLAGLPAQHGLYGSILPLVVYAVLGTSRQLIVGTSAAAAALVASAVGTLAGGDPSQHLAIAMMLTVLVGLMCLAASLLRLGAIADFLSRPILVGFMNGLALSIVLSQLGPLFGVTLEAEGFFPRVLEFLGSLPRTHLPTLVVGLASLGVLLAAGRFAPRLPAALVAMLVAGVAVQLFALQAAGVGVIGAVPAGLPSLTVPFVPLHQMPVLLAEAAGLTLLSFSSTMLAARSFADRNRYDVDADREIAALGAANVTAALSQSFTVTGSALRTAVAEAAGARTQLAGLVAAVALVPVLLFFTGPLQYIPSVALAAILISAGSSMLNWHDLRAIHRIEPQEFWLAMIATAGVLVFGAIQAILLVVVLALLRFVRLTARPRVEILGELEDGAGYQSVDAPPCCALAAGPAAVPLQRPDRVLQRAALQARGARRGGGGRPRPALVRDRPAAGQPDRRDRPVRHPRRVRHAARARHRRGRGRPRHRVGRSLGAPRPERSAHRHSLLSHAATRRARQSRGAAPAADRRRG